MELISANPASEEIIKPLAVGRDIRRWAVKQSDRWLIVTKIGVDIKRYPAIFEHLSQWKPELRKRSDQGNHWWELRACAYYDIFDRPKIVYQRFQVQPSFAFDIEGHYTNDAVYLMATDDMFLLAVLNSKPFWQEIGRHCTRIQNGYQLLTANFVNTRIPIPKDGDRAALASLAAECICGMRSGVTIGAIDSEIDERVARLYAASED
jgi:hypothetical protein